MSKSKLTFAVTVCGCLVITGLLSGVSAQDAMFVDSSGNVGVGTNSPANRLHVFGTSPGGNDRIRVTNASGTATTRTMLVLENNGIPSFLYRNTNTGDSWAQNPAFGDFKISQQGSAGAEFNLEGGTGNLTIMGTLSEGSSRDIKESIAVVNGSAILEKLSRLSISEWSYEGDENGRHMGPMAEDWYQIFGLGPDNRHIAPKDMAGVALVGVKELQQKTNRLEMENKKLRRRLAEMEEKISRLSDSNDRAE